MGRISSAASRALDEPWALRHGRRDAAVVPLLSGTPWPLLAVLAAVLVAGQVFALAGWRRPIVVHVAAATAAHGALLATAIAWAMPARAGVRPLVAVVLMLLGTAGSAVSSLGALGYLVAPAWVAALAGRERLDRIGLDVSVSARTVLAGAGTGAVLATHLLLSASLTLGYRVGAIDLGRLLPLVGYDIGANVLAAECFFRGALFNRLQRRWSFTRAAVVSTAAYLLRYLVDPSLPRNVEALVGALFYLGLVGAVNCWLLRWSGSLVPGFLNALLFFGAYRLLVVP